MFRRCTPPRRISTNDAKPIRHFSLFPLSFGYERRKGWNINQLSISCGFRHRLRAASPVVDCQCHGNLGFSGSQFLIGIVGYSCQHFLFPALHLPSRVKLQCTRNALLPLIRPRADEPISSVMCLSPGTFSAPLAVE